MPARSSAARRPPAGLADAGGGGRPADHADSPRARCGAAERRPRGAAPAAAPLPCSARLAAAAAPAGSGGACFSHQRPGPGPLAPGQGAEDGADDRGRQPVLVAPVGRVPEGERPAVRAQRVGIGAQQVGPAAVHLEGQPRHPRPPPGLVAGVGGQPGDLLAGGERRPRPSGRSRSEARSALRLLGARPGVLPRHLAGPRAAAAASAGGERRIDRAPARRCCRRTSGRSAGGPPPRGGGRSSGGPGDGPRASAPGGGGGRAAGESPAGWRQPVEEAVRRRRWRTDRASAAPRDRPAAGCGGRPPAPRTPLSKRPYR